MSPARPILLGLMLAAFAVPAGAQEIIDGIVGVVLNDKTQPGKIAMVVPKGPAAQAGLKQGDVIVSVDGRPVAGMPFKQLAKALQGIEGTTVRVGVKFANSGQTKEVTLTRVHPSRILAKPRSVAPKTAEAAMRLSKADFFAVGPVGRGGQPSQAEADFRIVLADPMGRNVFVGLLKSGTPSAQMYSLLGLHQVAPREFARKVTPYLKNQEQIRTMQGCLVSDTPVATVAKDIQAGKYDPQIGASK